MKKVSLIEGFKVFCCGLAMGAADVVPGVSGGTIAFITGIYSRLLDAIKSVDLKFFKLIVKGNIKGALNKIPFSFVLPLLLGIISAIFTLAHLVLYLLNNKPLYIWTFFLGLILASAYILFKGMKHKNIFSYVFLVLGLVFALCISALPMYNLPNSLVYVFFSGLIAISAMILPGISGSFLLLILGQYYTILNAVTSFNIPVLLSFIAGALIGIVSFARLLSYTLKKYYNSTVAFLTGIMLGSIKHIYDQIPMIESPSLIITALICIALGSTIPLVLHFCSKKV